MQKNAEKYYCFYCNFKCSKKSNFNNHLLTLKHKMIVNDSKKSQKIPFIRNYGHINLRNHIIMIHVLS